MINISGKNIMLDALAAQCGYLALFTDDAGTVEVSGGSPAYARKAVSWNAAADGQITNDGQVLFDVPAGVQVRAIAMMTAETGGIQHAFKAPNAIESWTGQGEYKVPDATGFILNMPEPAEE